MYDSQLLLHRLEMAYRYIRILCLHLGCDVQKKMHGTEMQIESEQTANMIECNRVQPVTHQQLIQIGLLEFPFKHVSTSVHQGWSHEMSCDVLKDSL